MKSRFQSRVRISRFWLLFLGLSFVALLLTVPGAGSAAPADKPFKLKFAEPSFTAMSWPLYAAKEKGFFKAEALEMEWNIVANPQDLTRALMAGSFAVAVMNTPVPIGAAEKGGNVRIIAGLGKDIPYDLMGAKGIKSIKELRGKKISASSLRSGTTILTRKVLEAEGLKEGDYGIIVAGSSPERYAAVKGGSVAASPMGPPFNIMAMVEGFPKLVSYKKYIGDYQWLILMANTDFGKEHPDVVVRFLKGVVRGQQWMADKRNKEEAIKLLIKELKMTKPGDDKIAATSYEYLYDELQGMTADGSLSDKGMQTAVELMAEGGQVKPGTPWKKYADLSFVEKAQKELGLR